MCASPEVGFIIPVSIFIVVVFPAPLCPNRPKISFWPIEIEKFWTALILSKSMQRFLATIGSLVPSISSVYWSSTSLLLSSDPLLRQKQHFYEIPKLFGIMASK